MTIYRWYVYELIDPRDGLAFYVGKGCGNRIHAHEIEARKAVGVCSEKINKIKDIWNEDLAVVRSHVAYFMDEAQAYAYEAERVAEYGLDSLTNIMPGGGASRGSFIRQKQVPVKPWTPESVVRTLVTGDKSLLFWFAEWCKVQAGSKLSLTGGKFAISFLTVAFEKIFPMAMEKIKESPAAVAELRSHVKRYGADLYGCA